MKPRHHITATLLLLTFAAGLAAQTASRPLNIVAVNYPLAWMAKTLGGDAVSVRTVAPAGEDPAMYQATRDEILDMQGADLILLNGAGYEAWTRNAALPFNTVVVTTPIEHWIEQTGEHAHRHGPAEAGGSVHSHGAYAFTTWLDPSVAKQQAHSVAQSLIRAAAKTNALNPALIKQRLDDIHATLNRIDAQQAQAVAQDPNRALLASHPVYQYLENAYDLNLRSVHWEPEQMPDESEWWAFAELLSQHPARHMLWEAEPGEAIRKRLATLGVSVHIYTPASNPEISANYAEILRVNAAALQAAFRD